MNTKHYKSKIQSVEPVSSGMSIDLLLSGLSFSFRLFISSNLSSVLNRLLPNRLLEPTYLSPFDSALKIFTFNLIAQAHISSYRFNRMQKNQRILMHDY